MRPSHRSMKGHLYSVGRRSDEGGWSVFDNAYSLGHPLCPCICGVVRCSLRSMIARGTSNRYCQDGGFRIARSKCPLKTRGIRKLENVLTNDGSVDSIDSTAPHLTNSSRNWSRWADSRRSKDLEDTSFEHSRRSASISCKLRSLALEEASEYQRENAAQSRCTA